MTKTTLATLKDVNEAMNSWLLVDATGQVLGRLAAAIAEVLMGKHKPNYTPHMLVGDGVIVINAGKVAVSGNKRETEVHTYYTGYPGGLKANALGDRIEHNPEEVIQLAVRRMLPKNRLARKMMSRLKVYRGSEHPHTAQKPGAFPINAI